MASSTLPESTIGHGADCEVLPRQFSRGLVEFTHAQDGQTIRRSLRMIDTWLAVVESNWFEEGATHGEEN